MIERRVASSFVFIVWLGLSASSHVYSQPAPNIYFEAFLTGRFAKAAGEPWQLDSLCPVSTSRVARSVFRNYGAIFAASDTVVPPDGCIYSSEADVKRFQDSLKSEPILVRGTRIVLQTRAAETLNSALAEAGLLGLQISPLDGAIAGDRTYGQTLELWNSRVFPALEYWIRRGRLSHSDWNELARLDLEKKIEKILDWEAKGIYFSPSRTRSILTSTAPPGVSQHLSLLAFDVVEYSRRDVRMLLNRHGWYQTIVDDPPHFTFLGVPESELPSRGLRPVSKGGYKYWIPNLSPAFEDR